MFSILALSGNLFAKERKGADLIVQRTDGTKVRGELIAIKENSLLMNRKQKTYKGKKKGASQLLKDRGGSSQNRVPERLTSAL